MKTRKAGCLFKLIKLLVLSLVIIGAFLYFTIPYMVPSAVRYAGKIVGIDMGLGSFSMAITEQKVELEDFYLANPKGFKEGSNAVTFTKISLDLGLSLSDFLAKDLIVVDEIIVDGFELSMEYAGGASLFTNDSNINAILAKLKSEDAKEDAQEVADKVQGKSEKDYKIVIKKIVFKNGKVGGGVSGINLNIPLPNFEILNIGVIEGGVSPLDAGLTIFSEMTTQGLSAIASSAGGAIMDAGSAVGGAAVDAGSAVGGAANDVGSAIGNAISDGYEGIKSIFDGF